MIKYNNINWSNILAPLALYLSFIIVSYSVDLLWWALLFLLIINLANIFLFPGIKTLNLIRFLFAYLGAVFSLSLFTYVSLLPNKSSAHFLIILGVIMLYHYLKLVSKKFSPKKILDNVLHLLKQKTFNFAYIGVSLYINFLAVFFALSSLFALKSFVNLNWSLIISLIALIVIPLTITSAQSLGLFNSAEQKKYWLSLAWILFIISSALLFLPLNYSLIGLIFALIYYSAINLVRFNLSGKLDVKRKKWYFLFPLFTIILILITANWL
jgi:hypothetical protein